MTTTERALLEAIAVRLAAAGVGIYRDSGAYSETERGIVFGIVPPSPSGVLTLAVYQIGQDPDPDLPGRHWRVQVRGREHGALVLADVMEDVQTALTAHRTEWDGTRISRCWRLNVAVLGVDDNQRSERADNYHILTTS